jgi:signal transduction histidine kinase
MIDRFKDRQTTYIFNIVAVMVLLGSIGIYMLFKNTKDTVESINMKSNLEYIDNITQNISSLILKSTYPNIFNSLNKSKSLRDYLEKSLRLFITKKYRYIYVVDREKKSDGQFRFLLDGSPDADDKSEFKENYTPLNLAQWNRVYETKKAIYFKHKDIKSLWLTYLRPIIVKDKVEAIIAVDFSLEDHKGILKSLAKLDNTLKITVLFAVFIFAIIIFFSYLDKKRLEELREKSNEIERFNKTLQEKIEKEVEKNRKKDQQMIQQSRLAQMGEMLSMIAHQWRQPLNAISGTSGALKLKAQLHKLDDKTIIELSDKISEYSQHLSSTINDFRDFFKSKKEKINTSYDELIDSVLSIIETSIVNKNIKLIKELNSKEQFYTYPNELKQLILNLVKNAEDVLIEKDVENAMIKIKTYDNVLEVSDNGGGIPEEIMDKIFDPYFSTKMKKDGTGLGLYMSKTIVEEHCGGTLSVENRDGGAVFIVKL